MAKNNSGKYGALLGVLIVFIIPFCVMTYVYFFSKKPERYTLPELYNGKVTQLERLSSATDTLDFASLNEDIKVLVNVNETTVEHLNELKSLYKKSLTYPKKDFKDPYPTVEYVFFTKENLTNRLENNSENWSVFSLEQIKDETIQKAFQQSDILVLDRVDKIRAEYALASFDAKKFEKDLVNLMAQTYHVNKKTKREERLKKRL